MSRSATRGVRAPGKSATSAASSRVRCSEPIRRCARATASACRSSLRAPGACCTTPRRARRSRARRSTTRWAAHGWPRNSSASCSTRPQRGCSRRRSTSSVSSVVPLDHANSEDALLASGSIPLVCDPVRNPASAPRGDYWDGGLIDYHLLLPYGRLLDAAGSSPAGTAASCSTPTSCRTSPPVGSTSTCRGAPGRARTPGSTACS